MAELHNVPQYSPKHGKLYFGLDFDGTYTECPEVFDEFIDALKEQGHSVYFVTFRGGDIFAPVKQAADKLGIPAIATDGAAKRETCEQHGVFIDIWIDDMPDLIVR